MINSKIISNIYFTIEHYALVCFMLVIRLIILNFINTIILLREYFYKIKYIKYDLITNETNRNSLQYKFDFAKLNYNLEKYNYVKIYISNIIEINGISYSSIIIQLYEIFELSTSKFYKTDNHIINNKVCILDNLHHYSNITMLSCNNIPI